MPQVMAETRDCDTIDVLISDLELRLFHLECFDQCLRKVCNSCSMIRNARGLVSLHVLTNLDNAQNDCVRQQAKRRRMCLVVAHAAVAENAAYTMSVTSTN